MMSNLYIAMSDLMDAHALDDALEAESVHGALSFLAVTGHTQCSKGFIRRAWGDDLLELPESVRKEWLNHCDQLLAELVSSLHDGLTPILPFSPTLDWQDSAQQAWCVGFMLGLLDGSEHLPPHDPEAWAEAILPIEVGSGLFAEDAEFASFYEDDALLSSLLEQIPEVMIDLFLLINASAQDE